MEVQNEIRDYIVENILFGDGQRLEADAPFRERGILDSTGFLDIITFVEGRFGIKIEDIEVVPDNFNSLRKISDFVERKISNKTTAQVIL